MSGFVLYELVNTKVRDSFDLICVESVILETIAHVYPEATDITVFDSFYCFRAPGLSVTEHNRRVRGLGRMLAKKCQRLPR